MASMDPCFRPRASICECFLGSPVVPSEAGDESNYAEGNIKRSSTWFIICSPAVSEGLRFNSQLPGRVAQSVGHLTRKSGVLGSIPGLATYFRFSFRFFKKGSCQLLAKVCARSTG